MGTKGKRIFCLLVALVFLFTNTSIMSVFAEEANENLLQTKRPVAEMDETTENDTISSNEIPDSQSDESLEQNTISIDLNAGANGDRTVYYDATLSKVNYSDGSNDGNDYAGGNPNNSIPLSGGKVYYYAWSSTDSTLTTYGEMTKEPSYTSGANTWNDVWSVVLAEGYDQIRFANKEITDSNDTGKSGGWATGNLTVPNDDTLCFYADDGEQSVYKDKYGASSDFRDGEWGKLHSITSRGDDTNAPATGIQSQNSQRLYVNTTFYDYYSDLELNGFDRKDLGVISQDPPILDYANRTYMTHRIFNMALSDYYQTKSVDNPLYFGHFQWKKNGEGTYFKSIANDLNLYGYATNRDLFYHNNNSEYRSGHDQCNEDESSNDHYHPTSVATQNLVSDALTATNDLQLKDGVVAPFFNKSFLRGANTYNTSLGKVYDSVSFPFKKNGDYWEFNSKNTNLRMTQDTSTGNYFLNESSDSVHGYTGGQPTVNGNFFPFDDKDVSGNVNELNYAFGMKMEINFRLTENGRIIDSNGDPQDITFSFSGDDDIWIFIDGKEALDIGGGHGEVNGNLNFRTKKATISSVKTSDGEALDVSSDFTLSGSNTDQHTLTMYYMERGLWESNMYITFNFPDDNLFTIEKEVDTSNVNTIFTNVATFDSNVKNLIFDFDIKNLATHYQSCTVADMDAAESNAGFIMKQNDIADYGSVASGKAEPANGAKYSLLKRNADNSTSLIGSANDNTVSAGTVSLKDKQLVEFSNKFRRGSYLVVNEKVSSMIKTLSGLSGASLDALSLTDIFNTTYTIYDSGNEVSTADLQKDTPLWVTGSSLSSLKNVSGTTAKDGRTEKLTTGNTDLNGTTITNTTISEKPASAILFRNYTNPDSETEIMDLSVKYTNQFKTGAIAIKKAQAADSEALSANTEYSFTVTFNNTAGLKLEDTLDDSYSVTADKKITHSFQLKVGETHTISGIPAGTEYTITEATPTDGSTLVSVTDSLATGTVPTGVGKDQTTITTAKTVNGTIVADTEISSIQTFTFNNKKATTTTPPTDPVPPTPPVDPTPPTTPEDPVPPTTPEDPVLTSLKITKVDAADTDITLSGAIFQLDKLNADGSIDSTFKTQKRTTDTNGIITFQNLPDGTYRLKETKAPSGYVKLTNSVKIVIKDGKYTLNDNAEKTYSNHTISFTVKNNKKKTSTETNPPKDTPKDTSNTSSNTTSTGTYSLPQTGGMGTLLFTLIGVVCMGSAILVLFHMRRKKNV